MKTYYIDMDVTMSVRMWVSADCESQARDIAMESIEIEPHFHVQKGAFVGAEITECMEDD